MAKWFSILMIVLCLPRALQAEPRKLVVVDFENEADAKAYVQPPLKEISTEHATSGAHSLHVKLASGWVNLDFNDPAMMKKAADYRTFAMDVYNPSSELLHLFVQIHDGPSTAGKESAYNHGYYFLPPGQSTLRFSLSCLPRLWQHDGAYLVDHKDLKRVWVFAGDDSRIFDPPVEFYVDNIRFEDSGVELPKVDGLRAFQFGAARDTAEFPGFTAVTEKTQPWSDKTGFGWLKPPAKTFSSGMNPDDLGNSALGGTFVVNLKPGDYVVHTCIDPIGQWGWSAQYNSRVLKINGKEVLNETMDGKTFLKQRFCLFEDDEDLPSTNLWKDRVSRISPVRQFETTVGVDGKLTVDFNSNGVGGMCFLVVYPKAQRPQGESWIAALDAIRKERFDARVFAGGLIPDGPAPTATPAEQLHGFIAFPRSPEKPLHALSVPADTERNAPVTLQACPGERTGTQLGLYPLVPLHNLTVAASDLKGPAGKTIPASAFEITRIRHYYKRFGNGPCLQLMPLVEQKFQSLDLAPPVTRPLWLTLHTPANLPPGQYTGTLILKTADKSLELPINVTINPFTLEPADDLSISGMGTNAGFWNNAYTDPATAETWWQVADQIMALQAQSGFNALTGGPGMKLRAIKYGKADIDYADADRWMELARKHGLTKLGDGYQGFDVNLGFARDNSPNGPANNDAAAKAAYNITFANLLKIVYADVEEHARQNRWAPRAFYLMDEPSGPAVDSVKTLVDAHVQNAPGTRFSGYYAPADTASKRDAFYPLLQLSIMSTITDPILKTAHDHNNQVWSYMNPGYTDFMNLRHLYGRWLFNARQHGLDGVTGGFYYVNSVPYYDLSDIEGSWGVVYPSRENGINSTLWLEQISLGINDYRYLKTLRNRIDLAKKTAGKQPAIQQAEKFLTETFAATNLETDPMITRSLSKPGDLDTLRQQATQFIKALSQ